MRTNKIARTVKAVVTGKTLIISTESSVETRSPVVDIVSNQDKRMSVHLLWRQGESQSMHHHLHIAWLSEARDAVKICRVQVVGIPRYK